MDKKMCQLISLMATISIDKSKQKEQKNTTATINRYRKKFEETIDKIKCIERDNSVYSFVRKSTDQVVITCYHKNKIIHAISVIFDMEGNLKFLTRAMTFNYCFMCHEVHKQEIKHEDFRIFIQKLNDSIKNIKGISGEIGFRHKFISTQIRIVSDIKNILFIKIS